MTHNHFHFTIFEQKKLMYKFNVHILIKVITWELGLWRFGSYNAPSSYRINYICWSSQDTLSQNLKKTFYDSYVSCVIFNLSSLLGRSEIFSHCTKAIFSSLNLFFITFLHKKKSQLVAVHGKENLLITNTYKCIFQTTFISLSINVCNLKVGRGNSSWVWTHLAYYIIWLF